MEIYDIDCPSLVNITFSERSFDYIPTFRLAHLPCLQRIMFSSYYQSFYNTQEMVLEGS